VWNVSADSRTRFVAHVCGCSLWWLGMRRGKSCARVFGLSASIIVRADLVTAPPERTPAGLGTSVVIGADVVVVVPVGVVAMETMVVMMVHVAQVAEGPTGGDGRPRAGEASAAIASPASRSSTGGAMTATRSLTCCHWHNAHGDHISPTATPTAARSILVMSMTSWINDLLTIRYVRTMKTQPVPSAQGRTFEPAALRHIDPCAPHFDRPARGHSGAWARPYLVGCKKATALPIPCSSASSPEPSRHPARASARRISAPCKSSVLASQDSGVAAVTGGSHSPA
jgi:hypothetical protein